VGSGVSVGAGTGVSVGSGVSVGFAVGVGTGVLVAVLVGIGVLVRVLAAVAVAGGRGVLVGVGVIPAIAWQPVMASARKAHQMMLRFFRSKSFMFFFTIRYFDFWEYWLSVTRHSFYIPGLVALASHRSKTQRTTRAGSASVV